MSENGKNVQLICTNDSSHTDFLKMTAAGKKESSIQDEIRV